MSVWAYLTMPISPPPYVIHNLIYTSYSLIYTSYIPHQPHPQPHTVPRRRLISDLTRAGSNTPLYLRTSCSGSCSVPATRLASSRAPSRACRTDFTRQRPASDRSSTRWPLHSRRTTAGQSGYRGQGSTGNAREVVDCTGLWVPGE